MTDLVQQRSMLMILIAACSTARTAFEAADNALDKQLLEDLETMIDRSEQELEKLNQQIAAA
jgi:cob(I)alamin adenosyltransferase